jgi:hypothetical protein
MSNERGGQAALRDRIGEWRDVIGRAIGREPADGGVTVDLVTAVFGTPTPAAR